MQVPGSDNAGPGSDILGLELMSEGIETLLKKKKANGIIFGSYFILSDIFISEWTLSLKSLLNKNLRREIGIIIEKKLNQLSIEENYLPSCQRPWVL